MYFTSHFTVGRYSPCKTWASATNMYSYSKYTDTLQYIKCIDVMENVGKYGI